jgi:hypothetical protein
MEAAIAALLTQRNIDEAAKAVGISPNTLLNWMKVPEFQVATGGIRLFDGWAVLARNSICGEAVAFATFGPRINFQSAAGLCL